MIGYSLIAIGLAGLALSLYLVLDVYLWANGMRDKVLFERFSDWLGRQ